jgi:hypothetical protein
MAGLRQKDTSPLLLTHLLDFVLTSVEKPATPSSGSCRIEGLILVDARTETAQALGQVDIHMGPLGPAGTIVLQAWVLVLKLRWSLTLITVLAATGNDDEA